MLNTNLDDASLYLLRVLWFGSQIGYKSAFSIILYNNNLGPLIRKPKMKIGGKYYNTSRKNVFLNIRLPFLKVLLPCNKGREENLLSVTS